jgi:hypothetical protein
MSEIACLFFERELMIRRSLRRYTPSEKKECARGGYCNAKAPLDDLPWTPSIIEAFDPIDHGDPRWPKACEACGHIFEEEDAWQIFSDWLFKHPETGRLLTTAELPIGAIYRAHWFEDRANWVGPDGLSLMCRLPPEGHDWMIDGSSKNGGRWSRTGVPPKISVSPSILTDSYHGYLTDGVLRSC